MQFTVVYLGWGQVHSSDAYPPVDLLAGTGWLSWCLGFRRLPFSPIPVRKCPVERFVQCLRGRNSTSPLTLNFIGHKFLRPKSIHDNEIVEEYSKDYMYLACIHFINSVGNTFGLSPPLDNSNHHRCIHIHIHIHIHILVDQNRHFTLALPNAGRHIRSKDMGQN